MLYDGTWSTVCVFGFRKQEAQVTCRMLGFNTSQVFAVSTDRYGYGLDYKMLHLKCKGEETSLQQCSHTRFYTDFCHNVVGITCNTEHARLRLRDTQNMGPDRGQAQIDIGDGDWETVCVTSDVTAGVVCRQLGLPWQAAILREIPVETSYEFNRLLLTVTSFIFCLGNETNIFECQHGLPRYGDCRDYKIICRNFSVNIHTNSSRYPLMEETNATLKWRC
ncbi:lysyl oxidase homolog 3A-like [Pomacea canaliculata]|uniref:lysyl oxidase homolog 3A-like n=1 Tax=Pomacea canaliculata TaxID=400727 RepID=UPI000D728ADE|nr:lysyl oxidase homolog 3A-like [Pomacea canaliculata]